MGAFPCKDIGKRVVLHPEQICSNIGGGDYGDMPEGDKKTYTVYRRGQIENKGAYGYGGTRHIQVHTVKPGGIR